MFLKLKFEKFFTWDKMVGMFRQEQNNEAVV